MEHIPPRLRVTVYVDHWVVGKPVFYPLFFAAVLNMSRIYLEVKGL